MLEGHKYDQKKNKERAGKVPGEFCRGAGILGLQFITSLTEMVTCEQRGGLVWSLTVELSGEE